MLTYNSLIAMDEGEHTLHVNAVQQGTDLIMGIRHPDLAIHGLQIHPESVGSPKGSLLLEAFLGISSDG